MHQRRHYCYRVNTWFLNSSDGECSMIKSIHPSATNKNLIWSKLGIKYSTFDTAKLVSTLSRMYALTLNRKKGWKSSGPMPWCLSVQLRTLTKEELKYRYERVSQSLDYSLVEWGKWARETQREINKRPFYPKPTVSQSGNRALVSLATRFSC